MAPATRRPWLAAGLCRRALALSGMRFRCSALEARFADHRTAGYLVHAERLCAGIRATMLLLGTAKHWRANGVRASSVAWWPISWAAFLLVNLVLNVLITLTFVGGDDDDNDDDVDDDEDVHDTAGRQRKRRSRLLLIRSTVVCTMRAAFFPYNIARIFPTWFPASIVTGPMTCLLLLAINSGALMLVTSTFLMPLWLPNHIPLQLLAAFLYARFSTAGVCGAVLSVPSSSGHLLALWKGIDASVRSALDAMYLVMGEGMSSEVEPKPEAACRQLVACLQLVVGVVLPTYCLWAFEHLSRLYFLRKAGREGAREEWSELKASAVSAHLAIIVLAFAVCWKGLADFLGVEQAVAVTAVAGEHRLDVVGNDGFFPRWTNASMADWGLPTG